MPYALTDREWNIVQSRPAEQGKRRSACRRPAGHKWHPVGFAIRCAMARFAKSVWPLHDLLQSLRSLAAGWRLGPDDRWAQRRSRRVVQMIDTSVVRVHQHGACIANSGGQDIGRFSWRTDQRRSHVVVNGNRLPCSRPHQWPGARQPTLLGFATTASPARAVIGSRVGLGSGRYVTGRGAWANIPPQAQSQGPDMLQPLPILTGTAIWSSGCFNKIKQCRQVATRYDKPAATLTHREERS